MFHAVSFSLVSFYYFSFFGMDPLGFCNETKVDIKGAVKNLLISVLGGVKEREISLRNFLVS